MTDETRKPAPLKKFAYPFQKTEADGLGASTAAEVVDPQIYYSALASAEDGFYPIGANGQWHGGIHFGSQTGATLAQDAGIRCIADGEVIAYRIDGTYPKVAYDSCGEATYSTGFALVRHSLQLPPAPRTTETTSIESTGSGAGSTREPNEPSLIFYSLYMNLQHWKGYQDDAKKPRPVYWGDAVYAVAESATDADRVRNPYIPEGGIGLNLRDANGEIAVGFAPRGVKLRLGTEGTKKGYYAVSEVVSGEVTPAGLTNAYAYKKELTGTTADPEIDKVVVLDAPIAVHAGDLMGHLGQYQRYSDTNPLGSSCSERPLVQLDVFAGDDVEDFIAKSRERAKLLDEKQKTLLLIEAGATLALPAKADQQIVASDGITLDPRSPKTGDWAKVRKGTMEVVGRDSLSGYDKATRSYGNGSVLSRILDADGNAIALDAYNALTDKSAYTEREVMVPSGDPVWVMRSMLDDRPLTTDRTMDAWSRFPLQASNTTGPQAAWPRVVAIKTVDNTAVEEDGTRWWQVDVGTDDGRGRSGWAREKDQARVKLCTPWDWPGFELVKADDTPPATFYANHVAKQPGTPKDEQGTLAAQGASAESAPLFQRLYDVIDLDGNNTLTATEIRKALKQPWLAQAIARLITRYDSEWAGPMDKWNAIDLLIPEPRKADWVQEKKRIESLLWWDELKGKNGFPTDTKAIYFHPVGMTANFTTPCPSGCVVECYELETSQGTFIVSKKSFEDMLSDETYKEHPYVPAAASSSSGITVGYGYDLGHQSAAQIRKDLGTYYSSEDVDKFVAVAGLKKSDAKDKLPTVSTISISKDDALNLAFDLKKRYADNVVDIYPESIKLHPHCQGALLSLIFNRGHNNIHTATRRELGEIQDALKAGEYEKIPASIRSMKRVWEGKNLGGLLKRRDREADLFEEGLKCDCWK